MAGAGSGWSTYSKLFEYVSQFEKLKRLEIGFTRIRPRNPTDDQVAMLAESVCMEHWLDYRLAGDGGRKTKFENYSKLDIWLSVNLVKTK